MADNSQAGHNVSVTVAVELIGIAVLGVLAGTSDDMGNVIVIIMWGILLGWLLIHYSQLASWVKKA